MTRSLYSKFILGYLIFGLLGFIAIATFSSKMTRDYLVQSKADALYDEANIIASSCSTMYQGKRLDSEEVSTQIRALSHYLRADMGGQPTGHRGYGQPGRFQGPVLHKRL